MIAPCVDEDPSHTGGANIVRVGGAYVLTDALWLPRQRDEVFAYFCAAENLAAITPASLRFNILTPTPIVMREGTRIDYRLHVRGIPMRWRTLITVWDPPHRFVDEQTHGPYGLWRHEHTFTEERGGTRVSDRIDFRSKGGVFASLLHRLIVNRDVRFIFAHRRRALMTQFAPIAAELESAAK